MTFPLGTLYHGTKFAVEGLSESLHFELLPLGVCVKLIEPGMVRTDFAGRSFDFSNDPALTEYQPTVQALLGVGHQVTAQADAAAQRLGLGQAGLGGVHQAQDGAALLQVGGARGGERQAARAAREQLGLQPLLQRRLVGEPDDTASTTRE